MATQNEDETANYLIQGENLTFEGNYWTQALDEARMPNIWTVGFRFIRINTAVSIETITQCEQLQ